MLLPSCTSDGDSDAAWRVVADGTSVGGLARGARGASPEELQDILASDDFERVADLPDTPVLAVLLVTVPKPCGSTPQHRLEVTQIDAQDRTLTISAESPDLSDAVCNMDDASQTLVIVSAEQTDEPVTRVAVTTDQETWQYEVE